MLFNSFAFLIFFPLVCLIYFILPPKYRWAFLLVASYYFYMNWKPVYALLIFSSTVITYGVALLIDRFQNKFRLKKLLLTFSILLNFGILFVYKYFNFINESVADMLSWLHIGWPVPNLDILLPVGISFYTFQAVGYTIDVYRGELRAERHLGIYALFVSFFPQLVAGPIERARNLLPQFRMSFDVDYQRIGTGLRLMLWGFFMKLVVADRVSAYVDAVYNNVPQHSGSSLLLATFLFAIQIYCDFAGYSNIAVGAAKVMGFSLMENFHRPYFARSVGEFWHRWHISLSTWFKDYVYIALGGNRVAWTRHLFNLFITFLVSGIWHGANWTFVIWGALHGLFIVAGVVRKRIKAGDGIKETGAIRKVLSYLSDVGLTIFLVVFAWIFFRANSASDAFVVINKIVAEQGALFIDQTTLVYAFLGIFVLVIKEVVDESWSARRMKIPVMKSEGVSKITGSVDNVTLQPESMPANLIPGFVENVKRLNENVESSGFLASLYTRWTTTRWIRTVYYVWMISLILLFGVFDGGQFIYFQF